MGKFTALPGRKGQSIDSGPGGPQPPDMDAMSRRLDRLESALDDIKPMLIRIDERLKATATKDDVAKIAERTAKLEGAVDKLPTTIQLAGFIVAVLALSGAAKYLVP